MGVIAAYRRVLSNGPLARLLFGEFVSSVGDWLYLVALLVLVWNETNGDAVVLGLVGSARIIPYILLSVPAGIVADRFDRRLVLLITDVARGIIMLLIAAAVILQMSIWVVVVLAVTGYLFLGLLLAHYRRVSAEPGQRRIGAWPGQQRLVQPRQPGVLPGPRVRGCATRAEQPCAGLHPQRVHFRRRRPGPASPALQGCHAHRGRGRGRSRGEPSPSGVCGRRCGPSLRPLVGIGLLDMADSFVFGGLGVITVILAVDVFAVGEAGTGLLNSAVGVGGVIGAVAAGALVLRRRLGPPLLAGAFGLGIGLALLGLVGNFDLALAAMVIASAGTLLLEIVSTTLLQRIVPDAVRGRTLGVMHTVTVTAYAAGALVLPILAASQPTAVLIACGVLILIAGVVAVVLLGKYAIQEPTIDPALRKLAEVTLFAGLPPGRIETALRAASVRKAPAGEVVIRQGDEADNFYVIADGQWR